MKLSDVFPSYKREQNKFAPKAQQRRQLPQPWASYLLHKWVTMVTLSQITWRAANLLLFRFILEMEDTESVLELKRMLVRFYKALSIVSVKRFENQAAFLTLII